MARRTSRRRATHKSQLTAKGWGKVKPRSAPERIALARKCGRGAFMVHGKKLVGKALKFPVVPRLKRGKRGSCAPDCRGLRAAYSEAAWTKKKYPGLAKRVKKRAKAAGCKWAR